MIDYKDVSELKPDLHGDEELLRLYAGGYIALFAHERLGQFEQCDQVKNIVDVYKHEILRRMDRKYIPVAADPTGSEPS